MSALDHQAIGMAAAARAPYARTIIPHFAGGGADDSAALDAALDQAQAANALATTTPTVAVLLPLGVYLVPTLKTRVISHPLAIIGFGSQATVLDGGAGGSLPANLWRLNSSVYAKGLAFQNFPATNMTVVSDGSISGSNVESYGSDFTQDIDCIAFDDVAFKNVKRPLFGFSSNPSPTVKRLVARQMYVDGAYCGIWFHVWSLRDAYVGQSTFLNLAGDGSTVVPNVFPGTGYSGNGSPIAYGASSGVQIGADRQDVPSTNANYFVGDGTVIRNVTDSRNVGPDRAPQVFGIRLQGARNSTVNGVYVENIDQLSPNADDTTSDCCGIYTKAPKSIITNFHCYNAGRRQGAVNIKGNNAQVVSNPTYAYGQGVICANGQVWTDRARTCGVNIESADVTVKGIRIEGVGANVSYSAALEVSNVWGNNCSIEDVQILNCADATGIQVQSTGNRLRLRNIVIDGLMATSKTVAQDTTGIIVSPSAGAYQTTGWSVIDIDNIYVANLTQMAGKSRIGVQLTPNGFTFDRVFVSRVKLDSASAFDVGLKSTTVASSVWNSLELKDNDFLATGSTSTAVVLNQSPTRMLYRGNRGYLARNIDIVMPDLPTGKTKIATVGLNGLRAFDHVIARPGTLIANVNASANVGTNDNVEIWVDNLSGSTITAATLGTIRWYIDTVRYTI